MRLSVDYGQQPGTGQWHSPQQRAWGLEPHQKITPGLAEKLCFTATLTGSYAQAAALAARWGAAVDDSVLHQQVQRAGERADQQAQARVTAVPVPVPVPTPQPIEARPPGALVIMMDGWMVRHRGRDWGLQPAHVPGERVAWQECKSAVIYRLAQAAQTQGGRGLLVEKLVVACQGEPLEFGRRVQAEARRRGLGKVPRVYVVADGGVWIWNMVADRFSEAVGVLDFYHASQHLWALAHALHPEDEAGARSGDRRCRRRWRKKATTSSRTGTMSSIRRGRRKAVRSAAARWNPCAPNCKAASNGAASSGPNPAGGGSWPWTWPAATTTGTRSGSKIKNSVEMHPTQPQNRKKP